MLKLSAGKWYNIPSYPYFQTLDDKIYPFSQGYKTADTVRLKEYFM